MCWYTYKSTFHILKMHDLSPHVANFHFGCSMLPFQCRCLLNTPGATAILHAIIYKLHTFLEIPPNIVNGVVHHPTWNIPTLTLLSGNLPWMHQMKIWVTGYMPSIKTLTCIDLTGHVIPPSLRKNIYIFGSMEWKLKYQWMESISWIYTWQLLDMEITN